PEGVDGVPRRSEHDAAAAVIVGPARDRFRAVFFVSQAVYVFSFEQNILLVLVVFDVMLLVVDREILNALGDGMARIHDMYFEGPQRRMPDISTALDVTISFLAQRYVAVIVQRV